MSLVDPHGQMALDGILLAGGARAGIGLDRWLSGWLAFFPANP